MTRGMCSNDKTTSRCIPSQHSNPFYSTIFSVPSIFGRRGSSASVLTDRRPSYQYGGQQQCSSVSPPPSNNNLAKIVHFCTPTREYKAGTITNNLIGQTEANALDNALNNQTVLYMEEPKSPNSILLRCKSTEV